MNGRSTYIVNHNCLKRLAMEMAYETIRRDGAQSCVLDTMQTREELYDRIGYHAYEQQLDTLFSVQRSTA